MTWKTPQRLARVRAYVGRMVASSPDDFAEQEWFAEKLLDRAFADGDVGAVDAAITLWEHNEGKDPELDK